MRMKMVCDDRTLAEVANAFLALKKAQKVRERTPNDYKKYIDNFLEAAPARGANRLPYWIAPGTEVPQTA